MTYAQQRGRYWAALALIRCVMSSPAAAIATLSRQLAKVSDLETATETLDEEIISTYVYDAVEQEQTVDAAPAIAIEQGQAFYRDRERRKLREFAQAATKLIGLIFSFRSSSTIW